MNIPQKNTDYDVYTGNYTYVPGQHKRLQVDIDDMPRFVLMLEIVY